MHKKLTVTVGIPAYNEEANILAILRAVLSQQGRSYILKKIIVLSDASSDRTQEKVIKFAKTHKKVSLLAGKKRRGKVARLNQLYRRNTSDILIVFDADVMLGSYCTIEEMVRILMHEKKTVLIAAHQIPIRPKTFIGRIIYTGYEFWDRTRLSMPRQDHIQNLYGAATALRGTFVKQFQFPSDITDDRGYLYLVAKEHGNFHYTKKAWIYYHPVSTLDDFYKLADRSFTKNQDVLVKYFSEKVYDFYTIPMKNKLKAIALTFLHSPFYTTMAMVLNLITRLAPRHDKYYEKGMWEQSTSTKKEILIKDLK